MKSASGVEHKFWDELESLVNQYRSRCLWFIREDFVPRDREQAIRTLEYIERYGDRDGFLQARRLKTWLSQHTSAKYAG